MYQYLLTVAQKIINTSASPSITTKYYQLKKSILQKAVHSQSRLSRSKSMAKTSEKFVSGCCAGQEEEGHQSNATTVKKKLRVLDSEVCAKDVVGLYESGYCSKSKLEPIKVLQQYKNINNITNSYSNNNSNNFNKLQDNNPQTKLTNKPTNNPQPSQSSLQSSTKSSKFISQNQTPQTKQLQQIKKSNEQLIKDNQWLITQMDKLIKENQILRKIAEKKL